MNKTVVLVSGGFDRGVEEMNRKAHESEYMSSDIWKRNVPPVTDFKRGSTYNQFGMWVMWIYYVIVAMMVVRLIWVLNT